MTLAWNSPTVAAKQLKHPMQQNMKGSRVSAKCLAPGIRCTGFSWGHDGEREILPGEFWITETQHISIVGHRWNTSGTTSLPISAVFLLLCEAGVHTYGEHIWDFQIFASVYYSATCSYLPSFSLEYRVKLLELKEGLKLERSQSSN